MSDNDSPPLLSNSEAVRVGCILYAPPRSASVEWSPHLTVVSGKDSLADLWLHHCALIGTDAIAVVTGEPQKEWALRIARNPLLDGALIWPTVKGNVLEAATEVAVRAGFTFILLMPLGATLIPEDKLQALVRKCRGEATSALWWADAPDGIGPILLRTSFALWLRAQNSAAVNANPVAAVKYLHQRERTILFGGGGYSLSPQRLTHKAAFSDLSNIKIDLRRRADREALIATILKDDTASFEETIRRWQVKRAEILEQRDTLALSAYPKLSRTQAGVTRVLYISEQVGYSGAEESLCQLISAIDRRFFELHAVLGAPGHLSKRLQGNQVVVYDEPLGEARGVSYAVLWLGILKRLVPDVIHLNAPPSRELHEAILSSGIPYVQHLRNGSLESVKDSVKSASALIMVSKYVSVQACSLLRAERVISRVIYDEVDPLLYPLISTSERERARRRHGISPSTRVVLMIARLVPNKRHDLMLEAFARFHSTNSDTLLVLKTDHFSDTGDYAYACQQLIDDKKKLLPIRQVMFVPDLREIYAIADCLVLCSDSEALGRCVVEAMSLGIPVLVTDSGGTHEIVQHMRTGLVVRGGRADDLTTGLRTLLCNPGFAQHLVNSAREFVCSHLSAEHAAREVMKIYTTINPAGAPQCALERID